MEFGEKLQALRKGKGLTQEALAEHLCVSRTAVSKWESGRGYPSIDSIKDIASFFSVTVDELLSSEKILSIAKNENQRNIQKMCNVFFGVVDLLTLMLIVLPLYPNAAGGYIDAVNLLAFADASPISIAVYWVVFLALILAGAAKLILVQCNIHKGQRLLTLISLVLSIFTVLLLSATRQTYATIVIFALFVMKGILYTKYSKA